MFLNFYFLNFSSLTSYTKFYALMSYFSFFICILDGAAVFYCYSHSHVAHPKIPKMNSLLRRSQKRSKREAWNPLCDPHAKIVDLYEILVTMRRLEKVLYPIKSSIFEKLNFYRYSYTIMGLCEYFCFGEFKVVSKLILSLFLVAGWNANVHGKLSFSINYVCMD